MTEGSVYPIVLPLGAKTLTWMVGEGDPERILAGWSPAAKAAALADLVDPEKNAVQPLAGHLESVSRLETPDHKKAPRE